MHGVFMSGTAFKGQIPVFMPLAQMEVGLLIPTLLLDATCVYKKPVISC